MATASTSNDKIKVEGIWKINTYDKQKPFNIASSIGYDIVLKFDSDGTVKKLNYKTRKVVSNTHTWKVNDKGVINITLVSPSSNFISRFIMRSVTNDYLKVLESLKDNCYNVEVSHANSIMNVKMCKLNE